MTSVVRLAGRSGATGSGPDIEDLRARFTGRLLTAPDEMAPFLVDWRGRWRGAALAVAQPDTAADVAAIVRWCREHRVPITPQGGNTGLVGGSVPDASGGGLLLSLARLARVRALDAEGATMTVEAGATLAAVQAAADAAGLLFPLSLASEGTCTIGGNLATNAGGVAVLRYGNARALCLGLEVVTASGEIWDGLRALRKDNSGYDLRDLFIGSEGTLGVITAAVLALHPRPAARATALAAVASPAAALALLGIAQARAHASLSAFELVSRPCLELVLAHVPGAADPLAGRSPWYVLLELDDAVGEREAIATIEAILAAAFAADVVADAAVARSLAQVAALWRLRETISEAQTRAGESVKHDIALPLAAIPAFIAQAYAAIARVDPAIRPMTFGHLGDGNLHFNLQAPAGGGILAREAELNRIVHDLVAAHGGSISAEHGLGVLRAGEAARYKAPVELDMMRAIKTALDPLGIMNPGKLFA